MLCNLTICPFLAHLDVPVTRSSERVTHYPEVDSATAAAGMPHVGPEVLWKIDCRNSNSGKKLTVPSGMVAQSARRRVLYTTKLPVVAETGTLASVRCLAATNLPYGVVLFLSVFSTRTRVSPT
jgi:hypothetical protein